MVVLLTICSPKHEFVGAFSDVQRDQMMHTIL